MINWLYFFYQSASACSVCNGADTPIVARTYLDVTLLMSFLPIFILLGAGVFFFYKYKQ
jgi:hypothetical protein